MSREVGAGGGTTPCGEAQRFGLPPHEISDEGSHQRIEATPSAQVPWRAQHQV